MDKVWFDGFRINIIYNLYVLIGVENYKYFKILVENGGGGGGGNIEFSFMVLLVRIKVIFYFV